MSKQSSNNEGPVHGNMVDVGITRFAINKNDPDTTVGWACRTKPVETRAAVGEKRIFTCREYFVLLKSGTNEYFPSLSPQLQSDGGNTLQVWQIKVDNQSDFANIQGFLAWLEAEGVQKNQLQQVIEGDVASVEGPYNWPAEVVATAPPSPDVDGVGAIDASASLWFYAGAAAHDVPESPYARKRQVYGVLPAGWEQPVGEELLYRKLAPEPDGEVIAAVDSLADFQWAVAERAKTDQLVLLHGHYRYYKASQFAALWA